MSRDNWARLVEAVVRREQIWQMFHDHSRTPSISSTISSEDDDPANDFSTVQLTNDSFKALSVSPSVSERNPVVFLDGDIRRQYSDHLRRIIIELGGFPPKSNYLFLGNYVDHGKQSLETIPANFFNHECAPINRIYGFYDECKRRFKVRLCKVFIGCFNCLPAAALIDEKTKVLSRLVPGCRKQPWPVVLEAANAYIAALNMQVKVMKALAELLSV